MLLLRRSWWLFLAFVVALPLPAADLQKIGSLLEQAYKGQDMAQRAFYSGSTVRYAADGTLLKGGKPGAWTLDAYLRCQSLKLKSDKLIIEGKRIYFLYDEDQKALRPYIGPHVKVEIATDPTALSIAALQAEIVKVFIPSNESLSSFVPDYWKNYLLHPGQDVSPPFHKKDGLTRPIPLNKHEPDYTPEAQQARIQGHVIMWIVVDSKGRVTKVEIRRPLGMGLDDNAAQTLQDWKFKPSTCDGKAVAVKVMVELSFRLR